MDALEIFTFSLFFSLYFFLVSSTELCFESACGHNEPIVRFPFGLDKIQQRSCGYPGFDLSCAGSTNQTFIELPNSGNFVVQNIEYATQEIRINDANNCLPRRLLSFNLSGSPFVGVFYQDFTLFNCSSNYGTRYGLNPVVCLSGSTYTIYAASNIRGIRLFSSMCTMMSTITVPVRWPFFERMISSDLSDDLRLAWVAPRCRRCESRGGRCGLKSNSSHELKCSSIPHRGLSNTVRYAVTLGAGVPALMCVVGLFCFICVKLKSSHPEHHASIELSSTVVPQPILVMGLDGPTIESYPKTVLGESRRLPKPDDNTCPICLSEYRPKETLRTIPECHHCFHADCIYEWLRLNATCPICRNSPEAICLQGIGIPARYLCGPVFPCCNKLGNQCTHSALAGGLLAGMEPNGWPVICTPRLPAIPIIHFLNECHDINWDSRYKIPTTDDFNH